MEKGDRGGCMKKLFINTVLACLVIVLAGLVVIGVILNSFNPNDYKKEIANAVFSATGKTIVFDGELQTTVYPVLGLKTGRIRIADDADYGRDPFVQVDHTTFKLALMPLLQQHIVIQDVILDGVTIKFAKSIMGKKNWEFAKNTAEIEEQRKEDGIERLAPPVAPPPVQQAPPRVGFGFAVNQATCTNIVVRYVDLSQGTSYRAGVNSFVLQPFMLGQDVPLDISGFISNDASHVSGDFSMKGALRVDFSGSGLLAVNSFVLVAGREEAEKSASQAVTMQMSGHVLYDALSKNITVNNWHGTIGDAPFTAKATVLMPGHESLKAGVQYNVLASVQSQGTINLDAIMQPLQKQQKSAALLEVQDTWQTIADSLTQGRVPVVSGAGGIVDTGVVKLNPFASLLDVAGSISFSLNSVVAGGATFGQVAGALTADAGVFKLLPFSCTAYGGTINGSAVVSGKTPRVQYQIKGSAAGVGVGPLLQGMVGADIVSGVGQGSIDLVSTGQGFAEVLRNLSGKGQFSVTNGQVKGLATLLHGTAMGNFVPAALVYEQLQASFTLAKGVATAKDAKLRSPVLSAEASGKVGYVAGYVDLLTKFTVAGQSSSVTLAVQGPIAKPVVGANSQTLLRDATNQMNSR